MDKELNEDARTKQDLLYECSSLESRLSDEIVKNEHLEQQCKKQKEVINKAVEYIKERLQTFETQKKTILIMFLLYGKISLIKKDIELFLKL